MIRRIVIFTLTSISIFVSANLAGAMVANKNCTTKDIDASKYCDDFIQKYRFLITNLELKDLKVRHTVKSLEEFVNEFWKKRDSDPATPENETKDIVDSRLRDIESDILNFDPDIPGTRFGGLGTDMAHVYLLYGMPHLKRRLAGVGGLIPEMTVWYYFSEDDNILFSFLFLNKFGRVYLYDRHNFSLEYILEDLSLKVNPSVDDLQFVWDYLSRNDIEFVFRSALARFSYYVDITLSKALEAPEPIAFIAERSKPVWIGQPEIPVGKVFLYSKFNSFIGVNLVRDENIKMKLQVIYSGIDWEIDGDKGKGSLGLRISFQNKTTRDISEFEARFSFAIDLMTIKSNPDSYFNIELDGIKNFKGKEGPEGTLRDLIAGLAPGSYIVNIDLRDVYTKKYTSWQETVIKK